MAEILDSTSERKKEPAIRRLFEAIASVSDLRPQRRERPKTVKPTGAL